MIFSLPAGAQTSDPQPRSQTIRAVERGFFAEADLGASFIVYSDGEEEYGPGVALDIFFGYDILPVLSLSLGGTFVTTKNRSGEALEDSDGNLIPSSDLLYVGPMARIELALVSTQRNFLRIRGEGGVAFALPEEIDGDSFGGPGAAGGGALVYEHYGRLRHFSWGLSAGATVFSQPELAVSLQVLPLIKYTF